MTHGAGSPLINMRPSGRFKDEDEGRMVKWLATVRGPDAKDPPFVTLPRPQGRQTRVVITEYELPRLELAPMTSPRTRKETSVQPASKFLYRPA